MVKGPINPRLSAKDKYFINPQLVASIEDDAGRTGVDESGYTGITRRIQQTFFDAVHGRLPQYKSWLAVAGQMQAV